MLHVAEDRAKGGAECRSDRDPNHIAGGREQRRAQPGTDGHAPPRSPTPTVSPCSRCPRSGLDRSSHGRVQVIAGLAARAAYHQQSPAPVAQGIEHRPPEPGAQVRILPGAPKERCYSIRWRFPRPGARESRASGSWFTPRLQFAIGRAVPWTDPGAGGTRGRSASGAGPGRR